MVGGGESQVMLARIADQWLARGSEEQAWNLVREMLATDAQNNDALDLLERVVLPSDPSGAPAPARFSLYPTVAPPWADDATTMPPPPNGESTSQRLGGAELRRAATVLRKRYEAKPAGERLVAITRVLLETAETDSQRIGHHRDLVTALRAMRDDAGVFDHLASLVRLEPGDAEHPAAFARLADTLGQHDRAVEVLLEAADACTELGVGAPLVERAAALCRDRLRDTPRAIELFTRVMDLAGDDRLVLSSARQVEPLLASAARHLDRCDVLERI